MYLQNSSANVAICHVLDLFPSFSSLFWSIPNSRRNLSRKSIMLTSRSSKSSDLMIYSSVWIKFRFLIALTPCSYSNATIRLKEGDSGYSSLAASSKHDTANVARHGNLLLVFPRLTMFSRYLSARLTA